MRTNVKKLSKACLIMILPSLLISCHVPGKTPSTEMNKVLSQSISDSQKVASKKKKPVKLGLSVKKTLMPKLSLPTLRKAPINRRFNVSAQSVPAADFF